MRHDAKIILLQNHTGSTWRVWVAHWQICERCIKGSILKPIEAEQCQAGAADFNEFEIAKNRLQDHYNHLDHHTTPVVPWGPEHS